MGEGAATTTLAIRNNRSNKVSSSLSAEDKFQNQHRSTNHQINVHNTNNKACNKTKVYQYYQIIPKLPLTITSQNVPKNHNHTVPKYKLYASNKQEINPVI
jgi:hypothetical protein